MADRQPAPRPATATATATATARPARSTQPPTTLLRRVVQSNAPTSTQVVGFLTLMLSVTALLLLTGVTLTGAAAGLVLLVPLALLTSPVWVPAAVTIFSAIAAALCACGFFVAGVAGGTWMYRYFTGRHPVGADRVDYARSRIADTASHVKDYVKGVKDAAPGA